MAYEVIYEKRAFHELDKLEQSVSRRIVQKIGELKVNPSSCDIKKLKNSDFYRLRVGGFRIFFLIEGNLIKIYKVGKRDKVYERF